MPKEKRGLGRGLEALIAAAPAAPAASGLTLVNVLGAFTTNDFQVMALTNSSGAAESVSNTVITATWGDLLPAAGGTVNEFRIWDVALKANEIARHLQVGPEDVSLAPAGACTTNATREVLDMNGDCTVDLVDYAMFVEQWLDAGPITQ